MKRTIYILIISILLFLSSGCYYRDRSVVDESLQDFADYVITNSNSDITLSARENGDSDITISVIVPERSDSEQYSIINSVIIAINEYLIIAADQYDDRYITVHFSLPVDPLSGVQGEQLLYVTNWLCDDIYMNELIKIYPGVYGYDSDSGAYHIPDDEFDSIHVLSVEHRDNKTIEEYIGAWTSVDMVYVSTVEQAEELNTEHPDISFIGLEQ